MITIQYVSLVTKGPKIEPQIIDHINCIYLFYATDDA